MKHILFPILILCATQLFASKPEKVSITYTYESNDKSESQQTVVQHAYTKAQQRVLEDKFGVDVSSIVVSLDQERERNGYSATSEDFFSLGGTTSRGEWIQTLEEKVVEAPSFRDGEWRVVVYVEGLARPKNGEPIHLSYQFVNHTDDRLPRSAFHDGDDLFMRFASPVAGMLCVYLVDANKDVYCLLPYQLGQVGCQPIEANTDYLFFTTTTDRSADEYTLNTQTNEENNVLYIVFSPNKFSKAKDNKGATNWRDEQLPRTLSYPDFLNWLSKNQIKDEEMVVLTEVVTIRK